jgi:hypothetical protein
MSLPQIFQVGDWVSTLNGVGKITVLKTISAFVDMDPPGLHTNSLPVEHPLRELTKIDPPISNAL